MKALRKLLFLVTCCLLTLAVEVPSAASFQRADNSIQSIRRQVITIDRGLKTDRKIKKALAGFSAEGGELTAYLDRNQIVKLGAIFYGETGRSTEEYYYANEKLIFVLRSESRYSRPLSGKVVKTTLERFYFRDDQLIKWIDDQGTSVSVQANYYLKKQNEYLESSAQFIAGARSASATIESH